MDPKTGNAVAVLKGRGGDIWGFAFSYPFESLSDADQTYVHSLGKTLRMPPTASENVP